MALGTASAGVQLHPAGTISGITLVQHECTVFGGTWVSPEPCDDPEFPVPFCGCTRGGYQASSWNNPWGSR